MSAQMTDSTQPLPRERWASDTPDYLNEPGALRLLEKLRQAHPRARFWIERTSHHDGTLCSIRSDLRLSARRRWR